MGIELYWKTENKKRKRLEIAMEHAGESDDKTITVMLLGKTGAGKSLLGNRLLGLTENIFFFNVSGDVNSTARDTLSSNFREEYISGENISLKVIDTPGFFDNIDKISDRWLDILKAFDLTDGVSDALLFVINISNQEFQPGVAIMEYLMDHFHYLTNHTLVVFTNCEEGTYTKEDVLSRFNKCYSHGTAGISFVFSDQRGSPKFQQEAISNILHCLKTIKKEKPLVKEDFENFFAHCLAEKVKAMGISTKKINFQYLKRYEELEIELVKRYVRKVTFQNIWKKINNERQNTSLQEMKGRPLFKLIAILLLSIVFSMILGSPDAVVVVVLVVGSMALLRLT